MVEQKYNYKNGTACDCCKNYLLTLPQGALKYSFFVFRLIKVYFFKIILKMSICSATVTEETAFKPRPQKATQELHCARQR